MKTEGGKGGEKERGDCSTASALLKVGTRAWNPSPCALWHVHTQSMFCCSVNNCQSAKTDRPHKVICLLRLAQSHTIP